MKQSPSNGIRFLAWTVFLGILGIGIVLRFWHLGRHSLWLDEAWLALSLARDNLSEVIFRGPQDVPNSTPYLLSLAIHYFIRQFGNNEWTLRFLPAVFSSWSIVAVYGLCRRIAPPVVVGLIAAGLMAFNAEAIFYAKELKQYAGDVFWATAVLWLAEACRQNPRNGRCLLLAILGPVALGFSHPVAVIAPCVLLRLFADAWRHRSRRDALRMIHVVAVALIWALGFGLTYWYVLRRQSSPVLVRFWAEFFPARSSPNGVLDHFLIQLPRFLNWFFGDWRFVGLVFYVLGMGIEWRRDRPRAFSYWVLPWLLTLCLAAVRKYPFGAVRIDLFLLPIVIVPTALGAARALQWSLEVPTRAIRTLRTSQSQSNFGDAPLFERSPMLLAIALILVAGGTIAAAVPSIRDERAHPKAKEELRSLLERYLAESKPEDLTVVLDGRTHYGFEYYTRNSPRQAVINSRSADLASVMPLIENNAHAGQRVWLINTHGFGQNIEPVLEVVREAWPDAEIIRDVGAELVTFEYQPAPRLVPTVGWRLETFTNASAAPLAIDGNLATRWTSQAPRSPGQAITLDLGRAQNLSRLVLNAGSSIDDWSHALDVAVSNDGAKWQSEQVTVKTGPQTVISFGDSIGAARLIRLTNQDQSPNKYWSIHEVRAVERPGS